MLNFKFKNAEFQEGRPNVTIRRAGEYEDLVEPGQVVKFTSLEGDVVYTCDVVSTESYGSVAEIPEEVLAKSHDERIREGGHAALLEVLDDAYGGFDEDEACFVVEVENLVRLA